MLALVAGIHVWLASEKKDVDGRDKPGHDWREHEIIDRRLLAVKGGLPHDLGKRALER